MINCFNTIEETSNKFSKTLLATKKKLQNIQTRSEFVKNLKSKTSRHCQT